MMWKKRRTNRKIDKKQCMELCEMTKKHKKNKKALQYNAQWVIIDKENKAYKFYL